MSKSGVVPGIDAEARRRSTGPRRFPPPWAVRRTSGDQFAVTDANGLDLAFVYVRDPGAAAVGLSEDEARRIAAKIAQLPELIGRKGSM